MSVQVNSAKLYTAQPSSKQCLIILQTPPVIHRDLWCLLALSLLSVLCFITYTHLQHQSPSDAEFKTVVYVEGCRDPETQEAQHVVTVTLWCGIILQTSLSFYRLQAILYRMYESQSSVHVGNFGIQLNMINRHTVYNLQY